MTVASEYEKRRLENIKKNEDILNKLGLSKVISRGNIVKSAVPPPSRTKSETKQRVKHIDEYLPKRRSTRRLKNKSETIDEESKENIQKNNISNKEDSNEANELMDLDTWCRLQQITPGPWVDGHYYGWVNEEVRVALGIASSASEAWESNGGGAFSYKNPYGNFGDKSGKKTSTHRSSAKEWARKMMFKNPNAYFYRHTYPGEEQRQGEWDEKEIELFVQIAKTYGSGDKWGLFASHIPQRVGYQCSAVYREVIIPRGLIRDPNFRMTSSGKAIYVGKYTQ
eukprot:jgi/Galph1/4947/GphlegSOOS_G3610.1